MYKAFDLKLTNSEFENVLKYNASQQIKMWENIGKQYKQDFNNKYWSLLKRYLENGTVDGTKLMKEVFAKAHYDVFISYSHNDEDLIFAIAGMLEKEFNLNVFVDAFY